MSNRKSQTSKTEFVALENLDFSNGFTCDFETGICGPINEIKEIGNKTEETKNANNNLV